MARPRRSPLTKPCVECGEAFPHDPKRRRLTCSDACARARNSRLRRGVKRPGIGGPQRRSNETIECAICHREVAITAQQASDGVRTCSEPCRRELISRAKGGLETAVCEACGESYKVSRFYVAAGRRFCSDACRLPYFAALTPTGEDNPLWAGGGAGYYGPSWRAARRAAWKRDHEACRRCGRTAEELGERPIVHHVVPFKSFGIDRHEAANNLDNLVCLCRSCHMKIHWETRRAS